MNKVFDMFKCSLHVKLRFVKKLKKNSILIDLFKYWISCDKVKLEKLKNGYHKSQINRKIRFIYKWTRINKNDLYLKESLVTNVKYIFEER